MTDMQMNDEFDVLTATEEELAQLSDEDLFGTDISEIDIRTDLPPGSYLFSIEKKEEKLFAADPENDRKAQKKYNFHLKVVHCLANTEGVPNEELKGKMYFASFNVLDKYGRADLVKFLFRILGVAGDKKAQQALGKSLPALVTALVEQNVIFGASIFEKEASNGNVYVNLSRKDKEYMSMAEAQQALEQIALADVS